MNDLNFKNIINIDAFSKGLNMVTKNYGGIVPVAAICMIQTNVENMVPNEYARKAVEAAFFLWKSSTAVFSMAPGA